MFSAFQESRKQPHDWLGAPGRYVGKSIAVLTSGGDSQGMNAAVRAVLRTGLYVGCSVYMVREGYEGLSEGNVVQAKWTDGANIIQKGGTVIGSARCMKFRERSGRLSAALHMVKKGITNLVVVGGDGSLTGANIFKQEWLSLVEQLRDQGDITEEDVIKHNHLNIVGLVGSIDNDFYGTDMTIGTDSALHRIVEAIDNIKTTACSHQRCFIMEVMGRHCGYLALIAGTAAEADYVFTPESPPRIGWQEDFITKLANSRTLGQRLNIILVAEGAQDTDGNPITPEQICELVSTRLKYDTRVTVLGHVQRGGDPSAYDRILASRQGADAVLALMEATPHTDASVITTQGDMIVRVPLMECVGLTQQVQKAMDEKNYDQAIEMRGRGFKKTLSAFLTLNKLRKSDSNIDIVSEGILETDKIEQICANIKPRIMAICVGGPASGINAALRAFTRMTELSNCTALGCYYGWEGLANGEVSTMSWMDVHGWNSIGGVKLGMTRILPLKIGLDKIAEQLSEHRVDGLLVIGGFEALHSVIQLTEARARYHEFCIPIAVIPATISNNVPGSDISLGSDSALNEITNICDRIKCSAGGTRNGVFVVETQGGHCGYLATMAGVAVGADASYIFEEDYTVSDLHNDVNHLKTKMADGVKRGLVIVNEYANENYDSNFIYRVYREEGKGLFTCRKNVLGHMQQGGDPSPFDRLLGTRMAQACVQHIVSQIKTYMQEDGTIYASGPDSSCLYGLLGKQSVFTPVMVLKQECNFDQRIQVGKPWWMKIRSLSKTLAKHDSTYTTSYKLQQQQQQQAQSTIDKGQTSLFVSGPKTPDRRLSRH